MDKTQDNQEQSNPTLTLKLTARDVDNCLAFLNRANLKGTEATTFVRLQDSIAGQASRQLEAIRQANGEDKTDSDELEGMSPGGTA